MILSLAFLALSYQSAADSDKAVSNSAVPKPPAAEARSSGDLKPGDLKPGHLKPGHLKDDVSTRLPSQETTLDHLTLSLRDTPNSGRVRAKPSVLPVSPQSKGNAKNKTSDSSLNEAPALLSLREAEDAAGSVSDVPSFFGVNSGLNFPRSLAGDFPGTEGGLTAFDPIVTGPELRLGGGVKRADGSISPALKIALKGSYAIRDILNSGVFDDSSFSRSFYGGSDVLTGLETRDVNIGLRLGYSSFNLDASILRRNAVFLNDDGFGYEAGLSYVTNGFSARFSARQYREGVDLIGFDNEFRKLVSFEFGAGYRLTNWFGVTGGIRYFEYDDRLLPNLAPSEKSQMIFLGGRFSF